MIFLMCHIKTVFAKENSKTYDIEMKQDLLVLMSAYKDNIINIEVNNDKVYCIMKDNSKILYDDKISKDYQQKFQNSDLQDMLEQYYPLHSIDELMDKEFNPGRFRNYDFFKSIYGSNKSQIMKNLSPLKFNNSFTFNKINNASAQLDNVFDEIKNTNNAKVMSFIYPINGTFNYRVISGTNMLSPHSFGIAIDLKSNSNDYHKWTSRDKGAERLRQYPDELIEIFEKHNFIWGGKWGYFDILHFEYRPEIILKAKYFSDYDPNKNWYQDFPIDEYSSSCIALIDNSLK